MTTLDPKKLRKAVAKYREQIAEARSRGAKNEGQLSHAFATLLRTLAPMVGWDFLEQTAPGTGAAARFDGILLKNTLTRGVWEAKDSKDNLRVEITKKIARGYPLDNILFEDTRQAILYQNGREVRSEPFHLDDESDLTQLLALFLGHTDSRFEEFDSAIVGFGERVQSLCTDLKRLISKAHSDNCAFRDACVSLLELCQHSINPDLTASAVDNLLIQHLLIHRLIEKIFAAGFFRENAIAREIETVLNALTGSGFDREAFYGDLNRFYEAIEGAAQVIGSGPDAWTKKQGLLNDVYERFFQSYDPAVADTHGIVYTPQEIVGFMCASVVEILQSVFGLSLGDAAVVLLDPCTGTANFVVNLMKRMPRQALHDAYHRRLFANEVQLLPYYIAALNIEHTYYELMGRYEPFPGLCFVDTLDLVEHRQPAFAFMSLENTDRVNRQVEAPITVIVGNPPYNVGQKNENENNKNRVYRRKSKSDPEGIDDRISATYARDSRATNKNALSDMFVKFFRWATDRLDGRDGIVCFVSNNSFVDNIAFDGMRKHLLKDFDTIYHLDCRGNVRQNPKLSGTAYNVFGIQVGVGITLAVRNRAQDAKRLYFHQLDLSLRRRAKLNELSRFGSVAEVPWKTLTPDAKGNWLVAHGAEEFSGFLAIGDKEIKASAQPGEAVIFRLFGNGVKTNRDEVAYSTQPEVLLRTMKQFIDAYNYEVYRYRRHRQRGGSAEAFVYPDSVQWSEGLKKGVERGVEINFDPKCVRECYYRPFTKRALYFDRLVIERVYQFPSILPTPETECQNLLICVTDAGSEKPFMVMMSDRIVDIHIVGAGASTQCFPFYTYEEDGSNRQENITDWALNQFQAHYGPCSLLSESRPLVPEEIVGTSKRPLSAKSRKITKWDIFHYVYALLHHPTYRERFAGALKKELPHIPLLSELGRYVQIGRELAAKHVHYEHVSPYGGLIFHWKADRPASWRVEKMKLSNDKTELHVNETLALTGIPPEVFRYRLGNRSALEWVLDQYQVDPKTGEDPNRPDDPEYIVRLVQRIITVSLETVALIEKLPPWPESIPAEMSRLDEP